LSEHIVDTSYPVLVLKASRRTIHHGALGVVRSLGRLRVPIYAVVEDSYTPVAVSRYLTKAFVWKSWPSDRDAFVAAMIRIAEAIKHRTIVIPIDDLSAIYVAENAEALRHWYLCPRLQWSPRRLANKSDFYSLCARNEVPVARSIVPTSTNEMNEFVEKYNFPVVVKAAEQWRPLNKKFNVKVIHNRKALLEFCKRQSPEMVVQEYIPGEDWIYQGYSNPDIGLQISFTGKKLLDYPSGAGSTAVGLSQRNDILRAQSERFLRNISYSGIIDIDWRYDERDGQYKIMDCNPRVGMNFRMFETNTGIDVVRAQYLNLTGRSIEYSEMIENRLFVVEHWYLLSQIRGGRRSATPEIDSRARPRHTELAWWSSDDVLPFLVMSVRAPIQTALRTADYVRNCRIGMTRQG
jgi:D-aspartate ligase